jgi:hypothetical protein
MAGLRWAAAVLLVAASLIQAARCQLVIEEACRKV